MSTNIETDKLFVLTRTENEMDTVVLNIFGSKSKALEYIVEDITSQYDDLDGFKEFFTGKHPNDYDQKTINSFFTGGSKDPQILGVFKSDLADLLNKIEKTEGENTSPSYELVYRLGGTLYQISIKNIILY